MPRRGAPLVFTLAARKASRMTLRHQSCESSGGRDSLPYSGWLVFHLRNAKHARNCVSCVPESCPAFWRRLTLAEGAPELCLVDVDPLRSRHLRLRTTPRPRINTRSGIHFLGGLFCPCVPVLTYWPMTPGDLGLMRVPNESTITFRITMNVCLRLIRYFKPLSKLERAGGKGAGRRDGRRGWDETWWKVRGVEGEPARAG